MVRASKGVELGLRARALPLELNTVGGCGGPARARLARLLTRRLALQAGNDPGI